MLQRQWDSGGYPGRRLTDGSQVVLSLHNTISTFSYPVRYYSLLCHNILYKASKLRLYVLVKKKKTVTLVLPGLIIYLIHLPSAK